MLDDVRSTLRMAWVDPAIRGIAAHPDFFSAAWSATRPNITRSFAAGADSIRRTSAEALAGPLAPSPGSAGLLGDLAPSARDRLLRSVLAVAHSAPKVQLVIQAWATMARRQRIPGTGREEAPAKRGIPEWQQELIGLPRSVPPEVEAILDEAAGSLGIAVTPAVLQVLAPWPAQLEAGWRDVRTASATPEWREALVSIRRTGAQVLGSLPHPMDLQWDVLARRGLTEDRREALSDHLTALAAAMPVGVLAAAHVAASFGASETPTENGSRLDRGPGES